MSTGLARAVLLVELKEVVGARYTRVQDAHQTDEHLTADVLVDPDVLLEREKLFVAENLVNEIQD